MTSPGKPDRPDDVPLQGSSPGRANGHGDPLNVSGKPPLRKGGVKLHPPAPDVILDARLRLGVGVRVALTVLIAAASYAMCGIVETGTLLPMFLAAWGALCFFFGPYLAPPEARKSVFRRRYLTFANLWRVAGIFSWLLSAIVLIYLTYN